MTPSNTSDEQDDEQDMPRFEFSDEELNSNRNGFLSARQREMTAALAQGIRSSSRSGVWVILGFMLLGLCIIGALALQSFDARRMATLGPQYILGLCVTVVAVFGMIALSLFLSNRQADKLAVAQVLAVEGVVRHDSDSSSSGFTSHYVYFGQKRFAYGDDLSNIFPEGARFRVYYCKAGRMEMILSFERLS